MSYPALYPPPCSSWPAEHLQAVGEAFRIVGGAGAEEDVRFAAALHAYLRAGGGPVTAEKEVHDMLAALSKERGQWLWGPIEAWADQHQQPVGADLPEGSPEGRP